MISLKVDDCDISNAGTAIQANKEKINRNKLIKESKMVAEEETSERISTQNGMRKYIKDQNQQSTNQLLPNTGKYAIIMQNKTKRFQKSRRGTLNKDKNYQIHKHYKMGKINSNLQVWRTENKIKPNQLIWDRQDLG